MYYYLCKLGEPGMPAGGEDVDTWTCIQLNPYPWAIWASPKRYCGLWRTYLGDDAKSPSPAVRRILTRALDLPLQSSSLGMLLLEALLAGEKKANGKRWRMIRPSGYRYEVWLGNEIVASLPAIAGGDPTTFPNQSRYNCSGYDGNLTFTDTFERANESPLAAPYEAMGNPNAIYANRPPVNLIESSICHAPNAITAGQSGVIDRRGYRCDQSAKISVALASTEPSNSASRRAQHAVWVRFKRASEAAIPDGDSTRAYVSFIGDPTTSRYEYRLSKLNELTSEPPPGGPNAADWISYVLARTAFTNGTGQPPVGTTVSIDVTGSTINGATSLLMSNGPISATVTDTETQWGHPGFSGNGPNASTATPYFDDFVTTGLLDGGEPEFLDP